MEGTLWGNRVWTNGADWGGAGTIFTGTINVWGAPAFVDPKNGDYHIRPDSAAVDAGVISAVTSDIDGQPRPYGPGYDIGADEAYPALKMTKRATPDPVLAGEKLTYTIRVTNTGGVHLRATVTDTLPTNIMPGQTPSGTLILPGGTLTWTPTISSPGSVWTQQVVVTAEVGYVGTLTNVVHVTTQEGAADIYTTTSSCVAPANRAPFTPSAPSPDDGSTDVPRTQTLRWQGGDPDGDLVTYTVALGTSDPPPFATTTTLTSYAPTLITDTTYYWVITASDGISTSVGPTWRFTTSPKHFDYRVFLPLMVRSP
jgi:uncharacterized repeat protein (TIGR01451 family)